MRCAFGQMRRLTNSPYNESITASRNVCQQHSKKPQFNPLIAILKPQSNGPSYSNTVIGTLAVDGWSVTFGTARRGLGGAGPQSAQSPPRCTKCNSPPMNGRCSEATSVNLVDSPTAGITSHRVFKGLTASNVRRPLKLKWNIAVPRVSSANRLRRRFLMKTVHLACDLVYNSIGNH